MIDFVGAGPGAPDLITRRGAELLAKADLVIYAGSLVNPALLGLTKPGCRILNSAGMTLPQVVEELSRAEAAGLRSVRLHTGDPSLYGAIREQLDELAGRGISCRVTPGVSSFCAAAASLGAEYTLPAVSQISADRREQSPAAERIFCSRCFNVTLPFPACGASPWRWAAGAAHSCRKGGPPGPLPSPGR